MADEQIRGSTEHDQGTLGNPALVLEEPIGGKVKFVCLSVLCMVTCSFFLLHELKLNSHSFYPLRARAPLIPLLSNPQFAGLTLLRAET